MFDRNSISKPCPSKLEYSLSLYNLTKNTIFAIKSIFLVTFCAFGLYLSYFQIGHIREFLQKL